MDVDIIKNILLEHARLDADVLALDLESDLYEAGLSSLTTVNLMLAIEEKFDIEFSEKLLTRKTFQSIGSLVQAISISKNLIQ